MSFEQLFGTAFLSLGLISLAMHVANFAGIRLPISFWKLKPMQDHWGNVWGTLLHFTGYVIVPIAYGVLLLLGYRP